MIEVYFYGCSTCGLLGKCVRDLRQYALENNIEFELKNSKYDEDARIDHAMHLTSIGEDIDFYNPVVVKDGVVVLLSKWSI